MSRKRIKPELMSPAGHWPQLRAAIEAGADAVYFGLNHFSARAKVGFTLAELPEVMRELHSRGVKGFITFNTLVFDHEIDEAHRVIGQIEQAGVDAVIVQDIGIAKAVAELAPDLDIHGSTQMSITSAEGAEFARELGCSRVVLGRELSLSDIRKIAKQTDVELETFVHGALCVSYSGQCFSSEAWGGRSANRGQCAQACRLSYDLIVDGDQRDLGEFRYLLSPGDLYALEQVPELIEIGVSCLKIEGRYKDAEYVALTTQAYREAIDDAWQGVDHEVDAATFQDLQQIYSRGLGPHFMSGADHQAVVSGRAPRHRGVQAGRVIAVGQDYVDAEVVAEVKLKPGDGLVFDAADRRSPDEPEEGGFVFEATKLTDGIVRLKFGVDSIRFQRVASGDLVWRTHDPQLARKVKPLTKAGSPVYTRPVSFSVELTEGQPIHVRAEIENGISAEHVGTSPAVAARNRSVDSELLNSQLGRLGGTPFHLDSVSFDCEQSLFVPVSELNAARRELIELLIEARQHKTAARSVGKKLPDGFRESETEETEPLPAELTQTRQQSASRIHLLVRTAEQLDAAIQCAPHSITLDYLELYGLRPAVEKIKAASIESRVASPRILKPSEQNVIRFLVSLDCEILVRSAGLLHELIKLPADSRPKLTGDFSLNVANRQSLALLANKRLNRITPSHDLNAQQIAELAGGCTATGSQLEVIVFQHTAVFHTEHCVFCRFLSEGTDHTNCGHPCEQHRVALQDNSGQQHPVMADVGCRNTVFDGRAQVAARYMEQWQECGIRDFRLEFVHQAPAQVRSITGAFNDYFDERIDAARLQDRLEQLTLGNNTSGSLFVPKDFGKLYQLS